MSNIIIYTASAGCGKTESIANLYIDLINSQKALPAEIVCITYTEKAARELKNRIISKAKQRWLDLVTISKIQNSHIKTIHSFCMYLLRFYWAWAKVDTNFKIVPEQNRLILKLVDHYLSVYPETLGKLSHERFFIEEYFHFAESIVQEYFNSAKYVEKACHLEDEMFHVFDYLSDRLNDQFLKELTYDLVLHRTFELLSIPEVNRDVKSRFKFLIVDEFQDSNFLQKSIFENIAENIYYVGDKKQSIYRFQGAEPEVFDEAIENCSQVLELCENFRTNSELGKKIDKIATILFPNYKPLSYKHQADGFLKVVEIVNKAREEIIQNEAIYVAKKIKEMVESGFEISVGGKPKRKVKYSDFAVLSRKIQNIAHIYKKVFEDYDVPLDINFKRGLLEQKEIVPLLGFLEILQYPDKKSGYLRLLANDIFKVDRFTLLFCEMSKIECYVPEDVLKFIAKQRDNLFVKKISEILYEFEDMFEYSYKVYKFFGKGAYENVRLFYDLAEESKSFSIEDLYSYVNYQGERFSSFSSLDDSAVLISIHSAKGLSFPIVFLVGLCESTGYFYGRSPKLRGSYDTSTREYIIAPFWMEKEYTRIKNISKQQEKEELKRLFYVAITRPMAGLFLINSSLREAIKKRGGAKSFGEEVGLSYILTKAEEIGIEKEVVEIKEDEKTSQDFASRSENNLSFALPAVILPDEFENRFRFLSPSHIMDFKRCPAMFSLKYVMGLPVFDEQSSKEEIQQNAKVLGTTVHRVLELTSLKDIQSLDSNIALAVLENDFENERIVKELILNFFESQFAKEIKDKVIKEESELRFYFKLGSQMIYGIIDKVYHLEDKIFLIDFKTNLHFDDAKFSSYIPQLFIYTMAMKERFPQKNIFSSIFWLREGKKFDYEQKDEHLEDVIDVIKKIRNIRTRKDVLELIEDSLDRNCNGCEYEFYCKDEQNIKLIRKKLE
ncbi:UvrD-helicase domain-containing protein [Caldicellulosiruptor acetigenus]|uniref:UvrD-helicase domain-containing protein n=1 Tax=Caldicellulosiruptor acetigenus TaxID=301953 RepID=UPI00041980DB|nr:UvrD-helicase domain-containing protein [Caldicellulosiruptor acetigenus]WAM35970.1 UvrD-helicase domain-containing protein [Caldicellulosiruptor acetigenus]